MQKKSPHKIKWNGTRVDIVFFVESLIKRAIKFKQQNINNNKYMSTTFLEFEWMVSYIDQRFNGIFSDSNMNSLT